MLIAPFFEDAATQRVVRALQRATIEARTELSLVLQEDITAQLTAPGPWPAVFPIADLQAICKLVRASRFVAISLPASAPDSLRLVVGGLGCGITVDSTTLQRETTPRKLVEELLKLVKR